MGVVILECTLPYTPRVCQECYHIGIKHFSSFWSVILRGVYGIHVSFYVRNLTTFLIPRVHRSCRPYKGVGALNQLAFIHVYKAKKVWVESNMVSMFSVFLNSNHEFFLDYLLSNAARHSVRCRLIFIMML